MSPFSLCERAGERGAYLCPVERPPARGDVLVRTDQVERPRPGVVARGDGSLHVFVWRNRQQPPAVALTHGWFARLREPQPDEFAADEFEKPAVVAADSHRRIHA